MPADLEPDLVPGDGRSTVTAQLTLDEGRAACAEDLALVDAAYRRPGGPEAHRLAEDFCPRCPLAAACLDHAMRRREAGVWGGTSPNLRTRHGGPRAHA